MEKLTDLEEAISQLTPYDYPVLMVVLLQSTCTRKLQLHRILLLIPRILLQDDEPFESMRIRDILFCR